jgi:hypothetical protein
MPAAAVVHRLPKDRPWRPAREPKRLPREMSLICEASLDSHTHFADKLDTSVRHRAVHIRTRPGEVLLEPHARDVTFKPWRRQPLPEDLHRAAGTPMLKTSLGASESVAERARRGAACPSDLGVRETGQLPDAAAGFAPDGYRAAGCASCGRSRRRHAV